MRPVAFASPADPNQLFEKMTGGEQVVSVVSRGQRSARAGANALAEEPIGIQIHDGVLVVRAKGFNAVVGTPVASLGARFYKKCTGRHADNDLDALFKGRLNEKRLRLELVVRECTRHEHHAGHAIERSRDVLSRRHVTRVEGNVRERREASDTRVVNLTTHRANRDSLRRERLDRRRSSRRSTGRNQNEARHFASVLRAFWG